ncbi:hypothetical protein [Leptospira santarosai]|uniref:Uncharacterized protein n=3 Tax=Leptospira santarosai TaxID=28183 RepID=K8XZC9_9LEPT|nr:hypothetical protein [Leptospira santarosai]EMO59808.1 hypothetical protein LEP1GSC161_3351 [Leptospira santarosai str. CBC1416]EKO34284.1 hypothetical protein LEP1GSC179_1779 [Leptospira santarosai str. MOR084]EKS07150.1 hypothetical protein LEP1GSC071_0777 [Leptospira santarosai str. JET]EKT86196.1 hypothetical protein LSS_13964 [Leptospira santarosai serovar Shermani str. LT 821]EMJ45775.1 hypothetical protein LEP1GSC169_0639 [Leptospira santarosai str. HAI1349]
MRSWSIQKHLFRKSVFFVTTVMIHRTILNWDIVQSNDGPISEQTSFLKPYSYFNQSYGRLYKIQR